MNRIKQAIEVYRLSTRTKRQLLRDLEVADQDHDNLLKLVETHKKNADYYKDQCSVHWRNLMSTQNELARAQTEIQSLRRRVVGTQSPVIPAKVG